MQNYQHCLCSTWSGETKGDLAVRKLGRSTVSFVKCDGLVNKYYVFPMCFGR